MSAASSDIVPHLLSASTIVPSRRPSLKLSAQVGAPAEDFSTPLLAEAALESTNSENGALRGRFPFTPAIAGRTAFTPNFTPTHFDPRNLVETMGFEPTTS
jgi:hypothetical protein